MSYLGTALGADAVLDPYKRVRYSTGLVLGVDEFNQEQQYHLARGRAHHRALHGYGTTSGLKLRVEDPGGAPQVIVEPGTAISPLGEAIRVSQSQCAHMGDWLASHQKEVSDALGSPPGDLSLYVVLQYRECETDLVPIPGEACRDQGDASVASRVAEDFELALSLTAPNQAEEVAILQLGQLLNKLRISETGPFLNTLDIYNLIAQLADGVVGEPALPMQDLQAHALLRTAFRAWITDVRPGILANESDGRLLLGRFQVSLEDVDGVFQITGPLTLDQGTRPVLLPTRVLHERMLRILEYNSLSDGPTKGALSGEFGVAPSLVAEQRPVEVVATSWRHAAASDFALMVDGEERHGVVVAFGFTEIGDGAEVEVRPGALDDGSFQIFVERLERSFARRDRVLAEAVVPVTPVQLSPSGRITAVETVADGARASAAALLLDPATVEALLRIESGKPPRIEIVIRDPGGPGRTAVLDRRFESWVGLVPELSEPPAVESSPDSTVDINAATLEELESLPGIGASLAARVVARRQEVGLFDTVEDLLEVPGIGRQLLERIADRIVIRRRGGRKA